jgi:hypothetical protein
MVSTDMMPFAGNYFSFSIGFFAVLGFCIVYGVIIACWHQDSLPKFYFLRFAAIVFFFFVAVTNFVRPNIHLTPKLKVYVDMGILVDKFLILNQFTYDFGFAFGLLFYSCTVS